MAFTSIGCSDAAASEPCGWSCVHLSLLRRCMVPGFKPSTEECPNSGIRRDPMPMSCFDGLSVMIARSCVARRGMQEGMPVLGCVPMASGRVCWLSRRFSANVVVADQGVFSVTKVWLEGLSGGFLGQHLTCRTRREGASRRPLFRWSGRGL